MSKVTLSDNQLDLVSFRAGPVFEDILEKVTKLTSGAKLSGITPEVMVVPAHAYVDVCRFAYATSEESFDKVEFPSSIPGEDEALAEGLKVVIGTAWTAI